MAALQGGPRGLKPGGYGGGPVVVESHPVDNCLVLDEAEEPGLFVSGLGLPGDGADLHVAEPEISQRFNAVPFLVKACGEPEG
ncbi:hypothetical protein D9M72_444740 [compost metagenome]